MTNLINKAAVKLNHLKYKAIALLKNDDGMSDTIEKLLWVIGIIVIVGAILLWAVPFFKDTLLPKIGDTILDMLKLG